MCIRDSPYYGENVEYTAHMLPKTDDILQRAVNISVGVIDGGLGAGFGISILSSDKEIADCAAIINNAATEIS